MFRRLRDWAVDRFGLKPIWDTALDRRVAKTPWYYGDGAALLLLLTVLVATGAAMSLTYTPSLDEAYASVKYITEDQVLGWFVRALHYWSAGMMVIMVLWHVLRQVLVAGYKFPREGTWLVGVVLFFAVLIMSFTGYVLRWDERGIYALRVALHMFSRVPWIGEGLAVFVQGGREIGATTLTRIFAVHVIFVPMLMVGAVAWHLYLVILHGVTSKEERKEEVDTAEEQKEMYEEQAEDPEKGETFHPETAIKSGAMAVVVFGIVVALAWWRGPAALMPEANLTSYAFPAEEWWWAWYSGLIALLPSWIAPWFLVAFPVALFLAMVLLPLVDRSSKRGMAKRPWAVAVVAVVVIGVVGLTGLRMSSPWTGWPKPDPLPLPAGVTLTADAEAGRLLFARHGCTSCHGVAGVGRRAAVDLATLEAVRSQEELRAYILRPPDGVAMPSYDGKLTEEELRLLVEYVMVGQGGF